MGRLLFLAAVILIVIGLVWMRRQRNSANQGREVTLDPKTILFSLPTISDDFPATVQVSSDLIQNAIGINEDDWRQIEFVESAALLDIEREIKEIDAFKSENHVGLGWKNVYIRKERPDGLYQSRLPLTLIDYVPHDAIQKLLIGSPGHESEVKGGFAIRLGPSLIMYGRESGGTLINLGLNRLPDEKEAALGDHLLAICNKFHLVIVDWCAGQIFLPPAATSQNLNH